MNLLQHCPFGLATLLVVLPMGVSLPAEDPVASLHSVISVKASNPILHGLEVKTPLDADRRWVSLRGPQFYSSPEKPNENELPSYLNWYEIRKPKPEAGKNLKLTDEFSGRQSFDVVLGGPAFYLMPAQTIKDGPPSDTPEGLNHFIAFRIENVDSVTLPEPTPGKPAFVCVPAEEWHHADHFPIKAASTLLMVYEAASKRLDAKVTTIDQFGLNGLTTEAKRFVYVRATRKE